MSAPAAGDRLGPYRVATVDMAFIDGFMELMGDVNPVHNDAELAARLGLRGPVAQGPASLAHIANMIRAWRPDAFLERLEFRFYDIVTVGDAPVAEGTVRAVEDLGDGHRVTCDVTLTVGEGADAVRGVATVRVSGAAEAVRVPGAAEAGR